MMVVAEKIYQCVEQLPQPMQAEVLHFAEYLASRSHEDDAMAEDRGWSELSLSLAMQGMEDEESPDYSVSDLKESFS